ncbi:MAG TPA: hypothetical protein VLE91_04855 [Candidatus Saccharimonadales bacterium]|nr:hypothetical protein [Candidatus Saccharimonadales bacterium]
MDKIKVSNVFAAVFQKGVLDPLVDILKKNAEPSVVVAEGPDISSGLKFFGTQGTVDYLRKKGVDAISVVKGFDFDGRVKTLSRPVFSAVLADKTKPEHLKELSMLNIPAMDLVVVDLYAPDEKIFPESMDIGGQSLIRSAVKNYKNVALAFDEASLAELVDHLKTNSGSTTLEFRKQQAKKGSKFIADRCVLEAKLFEKV